MKPIFVKTIPFPTVWGGNSVGKYFGYDFPDDLGQAWAFSGEEKASSVVIAGEYQGKTIHQLWTQAPELFCSKYEKCPVIVSLVGPCENLSIQVHPDVESAKKIGEQFGKNEAWYFLESEGENKIVFEHKAKDESELRALIKNNAWDEILDYKPVGKDDFVYIPAGILHSLCKNVIVYEIQQATDITYRFYDYDRTDDAGNKRDLHLEQAISVLKYGEKTAESVTNLAAQTDDYCIKEFYPKEDFDVSRIEVYTKLQKDFKRYAFVSVVEGTGTVDGVGIQKGDNFIIPANSQDVVFVGQLKLMLTKEM